MCSVVASLPCNLRICCVNQVDLHNILSDINFGDLLPSFYDVGKQSKYLVPVEFSRHAKALRQNITRRYFVRKFQHF